MPESTGVYHVETHIYNHSTPRGHPCGGCIKGHINVLSFANIVTFFHKQAYSAFFLQ